MYSYKKYTFYRTNTNKTVYVNYFKGIVHEERHRKGECEKMQNINKI